MADRYWILGTGTWDATNTVNWSASSGGAGGASVPTSADNVFFDANSNVGTGAFTVTMANSPRVCNDFTASGLDGTMTLAGSGIELTVSGSLTFQATNFTRSYTGLTTFNATTTGKTITLNGKTLSGGATFDGVGGGWTLGSAFSVATSTLTITNGTFDTSSSGNYAVTAGSFSSTNTNTRTINLNASTLSFSSGGAWNTTLNTGLTLNAGTSQINCSNAVASFRSGGNTFYNLSFTSLGSALYQIFGVNTFNNLIFVARTSAVLGTVGIRADQTINGTLSIQPSPTLTGVARIYLQGAVSGSVATLTCNAVSLYDVDFRDITIAGAASPASGTRLGNVIGNSGITFPAAKTVYFGQTGSANWGATGSGSWSATSGGSLDATMFPLAQDTAIFPAATYPASGSTVTFASNQSYKVGTVDMSLRTSNTMTLAIGGNSIDVCGDWKNGTGTSLTGTNSFNFIGRLTQNITSAGVSITFGCLINSAGGTVILQDNYTNSSASNFSIFTGTLNLNGKTLTTIGSLAVSTTTTANITFNGGTIICSGASATAFNNTSTTGFTTTAGTGTGTISMTAATAKTFVGGGFTYNCTLNQGGAGALTITGSNTFSDITNTYKSTGATSILFTAGTTSTFTDWSANGEATRLLTIGSDTAASHTLSKASGTVNASYLSISRSTATGGATWNASNSTDGGNNSGWVFVVGGATGNFLMFF